MTRYPTRPPLAATAALLSVLLIALPAPALVAALGEVAQDDLAEGRALEELDRLHRLPEVLDYVPPAPWYAEQLDGEAPRYDEPATNALLMSNGAPLDATGTAKIASLAIEFTDITHRSTSTISALTNVITGSNSMNSYYDEVSYGQLVVDGQAYGWFEADNDMAYYGAPQGGSRDSNNFYKLVAEAVRAADAYVDFSQYDTDRDRFIDAVCLVHAGVDEATTGQANAIWSKQSVYPGTLRVDGVYLGYYFTVSEFSPVGVYVHEFGHMLGLPDLYDTDYSSTGVGVWDSMGSGAWNHWGVTPGHFCAWSKVFLGWIEPTVISNSVEGRQVKYMEGDEPEVIKLPTSDSKQYFLLENRYALGYDQYLPGSGLLIWHIDSQVIADRYYYNAVNNNELRKGVDLEEASGTQDLDTRTGNDGDKYDPWKDDPTGFTPDSVPDSRLYDGTDTKIRVTNLSSAGLVMTIDIDFGGASYLPFLDTISTRKEAGPGQTMVFNITVGTRSSDGDTFHLTLEGDHEAWGYLASSYQTLVMPAKSTRVVRLEVTPPAGTPKGVEGQVILRVRSQKSDMVATLETTTVVRQVHDLVADPPSRTVHLEPGSSTYVDVTVTNGGNGIENLTMSLTAERGYWGTIDKDRISLAVSGSETVRVTFSIPDGLMAGTSEPFTLTFLSEVIKVGEGGSHILLVPTLQVDLEMVVKKVVSLRWNEVADERILPGETVPYELTLFNHGNSEVDVIMGHQVPEGWVLVVDDVENLTIPAFSTVTLFANLTAPDGVPAGEEVVVQVSASHGGEFFTTSFDLVVDQLYRLAAHGMAARFADPDERAEFIIVVTNLGNGDDVVSLGITGNGWDSEINPNIVTLGTGEGDDLSEVVVRMTPPRTARAYEENTVTVTFTSDNGEITATHDVTLTVNPVTSFDADIEVLSDQIDPSLPNKGRATYFINLDNTGNLEDLFHIGVLGLPEGWTTEFENRMVSVAATKSRKVEFSVIPPTGEVGAKAGTMQFKVHVASEIATGEPLELPLTATIVPNRGHSIRSLEPAYTAPSGSSLTFRVLVVNEGNVPETVVLTAIGDVESYLYEHLEIDLEPFGQRVVNLTVVLPTTDEDAQVQLQVVSTTKDMSSQENYPVMLEVGGRPSAPGMGGIASLAAAALAAMALASIGRWRRR